MVCNMAEFGEFIWIAFVGVGIVSLCMCHACFRINRPMRTEHTTVIDLRPHQNDSVSEPLPRYTPPTDGASATIQPPPPTYGVETA